MRSILFLTIFIGLSVQTLAQKKNESEVTKNIYFSYGLVYNLKIDKTYSRLAKNGFNHFFSFGFEKKYSNKIFSVHGNFMKGTLKTKGNSINYVDNYGGNFILRYLMKNQKLSNDKISFFLGLNANFKGDVWFPQKSELRYGWDIYLGAGVATSLLYKINNKLSFRYDLDAPLIGVLWRSHNNGQQLITEEIQSEKGIAASAFETPKFSTIFNTIYLDNSFKLFYSISNKLDIFYNLIISYKHIKNPLIKTGYELNNSFGLNYKF